MPNHPANSITSSVQTLLRRRPWTAATSFVAALVGAISSTSAGHTFNGRLGHALAAEQPAQAGRSETSQVIPGCWQDGPVLDITVDAGSPGAEETVIGPYALPLSVFKPDLVTSAALSWSWGQNPERNSPTGLTIRFVFPDPKPFGLPYSLQGFAIDGPGGLWVRDWSDNCDGVGVSLFPNQVWQEHLSLEAGQFAVSNGDRIRVRVWGSRN